MTTLKAWISSVCRYTLRFHSPAFPLFLVLMVAAGFWSGLVLGNVIADALGY